MKKFVARLFFVLLVTVTANLSIGQAPSLRRSSLLNQKQHVTEERRRAAEEKRRAEEQFASQFGRTVEQQQKYEVEFDLKSVFGFEFGTAGSNRTVKLEKPFRYCTEAQLVYTDYGNRLYRIWLPSKMPQNATDIDRKEECERVTNIMEQKWGIKIKERGFGNRHVSIDVTDGWVVFTSRRVEEEATAAKLVADKQKPSLALPPDAGMDAFEGNGEVVKTVDTQALVSSGYLPEPTVPMEEALALAKKGDGKGFYQLAVRYAKGEDVKRDSEVAKAFLDKAVKAQYPRAVFAYAVGQELELSGWNGDEPHPNAEAYFTTSFGFGSSGHRLGSCITNETLVSQVYSNYHKAVSLGMTAATNEIARLDKRMAIVRANIKKFQEEEEVNNAKHLCRYKKNFVGKEKSVSQERRVRQEGMRQERQRQGNGANGIVIFRSH